MKTVILISCLIIFAAVFNCLGSAMAQGRPMADLPLDGMKLVRAEPAEHLVAQPPDAIGFTVEKEGQSIPVRVSALSSEYRGIYRGQAGATLHGVEISVDSEAPDEFRWVWWEPSHIYPRTLKLVTANSGDTYATYSAGATVALIPITGPLSSDLVRMPGESPLQRIRLSSHFIMESVGFEHFHEEGGLLNALALPVFVERIDEVEGEIRVTLHGTRPTPRFVFALREQWRDRPDHASQWRFVAVLGE